MEKKCPLSFLESPIRKSSSSLCGAFKDGSEKRVASCEKRMKDLHERRGSCPTASAKDGRKKQMCGRPQSRSGCMEITLGVFHTAPTSPSPEDASVPRPAVRLPVWWHKMKRQRMDVLHSFIDLQQSEEQRVCAVRLWH